jgi:hypothetical protein
MGCPFVLSTAAAAEEIPARLRACTSEQDDARRLSCYDREMGHTPPPAASAGAAPATTLPAPPAPPVATTAPVVAPAPASTEDSFGYRGTIARKEMDRQREAEEATEELVANVKEMGALPRGERVITLDNGQVWVQKGQEKVVRLKVGDQVTIRRASFGSFMLSPPSGQAIRVTRVQ